MYIGFAKTIFAFILPFFYFRFVFFLIVVCFCCFCFWFLQTVFFFRICFCFLLFFWILRSSLEDPWGTSQALMDISGYSWALAQALRLTMLFSWGPDHRTLTCHSVAFSSWKTVRETLSALKSTPWAMYAIAWDESYVTAGRELQYNFLPRHAAFCWIRFNFNWISWC